MNGEHRAHVLFSGTSVMQIGQVGKNERDDEEDRDEVDQKSTADNDDNDDIPSPPDNGCVCCCLRTGFASSQGTLVRPRLLLFRISLLSNRVFGCCRCE